VSADATRTTSPGIEQADSLYQSFPDFAAWGELTPSDIDLWDRFAANLNERRQSATPEALKSAVEVAVRAAALDTGAIEGLYSVDRGFTMTVALQSLAWEQAIEERGAGIRELFEAQLEAYELVLDAVTRKLPISEAWIRALHEKLCAPQKTYRVLTNLGWQEQDLPKGQYKTRPNHVRLTDGTFHAYAPVDRVPEEMYRLLEQMRTPEFEAAHPVLQASYCHYALVVIHPFADGNGRVARALASTFFYRAQSVPLVIFENQRLAYLESLRAADLGDFRPVISFFRDRGLDTMQLVVESLMTAEMPKPEITAKRITKLLPSYKSLSREELDSIALRILNEVDQRLEAQFHSLQLSKAISHQSVRGNAFVRDSNYHQPERGTYSWHSIEIENRPEKIQVATRIMALVSDNIFNPFVFRVLSLGSPDILDIRLEDAYPELTSVLDLRLTSWIERLLSRLLTDLERESRR
jgi:Fic family protein